MDRKLVILTRFSDRNILDYEIHTNYNSTGRKGVFAFAEKSVMYFRYS